MREILKSIEHEYRYYKSLAERAMDSTTAIPNPGFASFKLMRVAQPYIRGRRLESEHILTEQAAGGITDRQ